MPTTVWRRVKSGPPFGIEVRYLPADVGRGDDGVMIRFDMGTDLKHEFVRVEIPATDFAALMAEMIDANRRAFLDGVAQALLAAPDKEPE